MLLVAISLLLGLYWAEQRQIEKRIRRQPPRTWEPGPHELWGVPDGAVVHEGEYMPMDEESLAFPSLSNRLLKN